MSPIMRISIAAAVLAIGVGIFFALKTDIGEAPPVPAPPSAPAPQAQHVFDGRNATYEIEGKKYALVNGLSEVPAVPGSLSTIITRYFGNEAKGDLTGDGKDDIAFLISQEGGGTGLFYYAVVAVNAADGYKLTNAFFIGDRIAPQTTEINTSALELRVNYAERKPGEPMTARPSRGVTKLLKVTPGGVLEGLMR